MDTFNGLLQIARIEAQELRRGFQPVPLTKLIEDMVELYRPLAEEAGLAIHISADPGLVVSADRQLLGQALANLIDNATKYAAGGVSIDVGAHGDEARVELIVADHGPGVPEAQRTHVFDRLVRLDTSRGVPGTGLGLSFVAAVARLHGGEIELRDNHPGLRVVLGLAAAPDASA